MTQAGKTKVSANIIHKLTTALSPLSLQVIDESDLHAGHGHERPEGETHFRVEVVSAAFERKSRVDRHRLINGLLADELANHIHALAITARTPQEAAKE